MLFTLALPVPPAALTPIFLFFFYNKKIYFLLKKKETGSGLLRGEGIKKVPPSRYARQRHCAAGGLIIFIFQQHFPVQLPCYDF